MKTKWLFIIAAITLVISTVAVSPAMAYFTDTTKAEGSFQIKIGEGEPEIHETVTDMTKQITIKNTGEYSIYVRVKAIYPDDCTVAFTPTDGWSDKGDGYYYYKNPIAPGETTPSEFPLTLTISRNEESTGDFNVIIIQEAIKAVLDDNGEPDWSKAITNQNSYNLGN